jgi:hypothetical protein
MKALIVVGAVLGGIAALLAKEGPQIKRYQKISAM